VRKVFILGVILCLSGCVSDQQESTVVQESPAITKAASKAMKEAIAHCNKELQFFDKSIKKLKGEQDVYQNKSAVAENEKQFELAALYTELASAKGKMIKGIEGVALATEQAVAVYKEYPDLMKNIFEKYTKSAIMDPKVDIKGYSMGIRTSIKKCEDNAAAADAKGNTMESEAYGDMEAALTSKLMALDVYTTGLGEYKSANDDLKNYMLETPKNRTKRSMLNPQDAADLGTVKTTKTANSTIAEPVDQIDANIGLEKPVDSSSEQSVIEKSVSPTSPASDSVGQGGMPADIDIQKSDNPLHEKVSQAETNKGLQKPVDSKKADVNAPVTTSANESIGQGNPVLPKDSENNSLQ
jgi:hypothetical protein